MIDISTKKIEELEFTRGKDVVFITGNSNNEHLIVVLKNGNIYAIDNNHNIKHMKNLIVNSLLFDKKITKEKEINNSNEFENFKMFVSPNLDKLIIANQNYLTIWYRTEPISPTNANNKNLIKKSIIEELSGTFYNISLENEKKIILTNESINKKCHYEAISATFCNSYFLGSFTIILYVLIMPTDIPNIWKIHIVQYLFKYENSNKFKLADANDSSSTHISSTSSEYVRNIEKKSIYSYINYTNELAKENLPLTTLKDRIILKFNSSANCCAIIINCQYALNSTLIMFMTESSRFFIYKLYDLYNKVKQPKNEENKIFLWVEDFDWICNDMFIILLMSQGYIFIMNLNFQLISFFDTSNNLINSGINVNFMSIPNYLNSQKLNLSDRLQLITSKKRTDYFIIYSNNYTICFQVNHKNYESRLLTLNNTNETFDDFLYILKYFQMNHIENENNGLFDKIHNYMVKCLKELYHPESETSMPNENVGHIFIIFVKFIRIFRSINQVHEANLTIISYLIGVTNDFFYHLINYKEIWLAFLFIDICENYLLKHLKLKVSRNKLNDEQMLKNQTSYLVLNPYFQQNPSLKCYNKISNKVLHSRMRLILLFFALIEFRNNQALNINVLYFVLAKMCIEKLKKNNLLDDVQMIVKVVIRNWKYLKNENSRVGAEEFILNGLTMNYRTEILSQFIHSKASRDDIKFDFFSDFLPLDGLQDFIELHETYCKGDEEALINEYNYIYNIGIIQRWILFFTNFFYNLMFDDIKNYITNHIKQTLFQKKEIENISPEETNLSSLIYFNVTFFLLALNNHLKFLLKFMSSKSINSNEQSFISDNSNILSDFNNLFLPFISPADVPFIIFEFYSTQDNKSKKNLPYEINYDLNNIIINYIKSFNFSMQDAFDFLDFLVQSGFKSHWDVENADSNGKSKIGRLQKLIFSAFTFYIFVIHKLNQIHQFEFDIEMIFSVIDNMQTNLKTECYEFLFLILNGHLRFYLRREVMNKLTNNCMKYLEIVLNLLKLIYYKIVREEPFYVRKNISEFVQITPPVAKYYLLEGALFYEYKNFKKLIKMKLFNSDNLLNLNNFTNNVKKLPNFFEELTSQKRNLIFDILFTAESNGDVDPGLYSHKTKEFEIFYENFGYSLKNIILLNKINNLHEKYISSSSPSPSLIFSIENNFDIIRKLILNAIKEKIKENYNEKSTFELAMSLTDNIVKCNFENKILFKSSNNELKNRLEKSIKLGIFKSMHIFNILFIKFKSFYTLNPQADILLYLKHVTYVLISGAHEYSKQDTLSGINIIDYLLTINLKDLKEQDKISFLEVMKNLHILFIKLKKNLNVYPKIIDLEEKIKLENKDLSTKLRNILTDDIPKMRMVFENFSSLKSHILKIGMMLLFHDGYCENLMSVYNLMDNYAMNQNTKNPLKICRKRYIETSESFYKITGIPTKNFIDFTDNWQLVNNEELYNLIINDESFSNENREEEKLNTSVILNRRQKLGCDTPRKKVTLAGLNENNVLINTYVNESNLNSSFTKDTNRSFDLREERESSTPNSNNTYTLSNSIKCSSTIKLKAKKTKANLPKYKIENRNKIIDDDNISVVTMIKKNELKAEDVDNKSSNTILHKKNIANNEEDEEGNINITDGIKENFSSSPIPVLISKINKIFFDQLKSNIFYKYKEEIRRKELEEIKIYNIKPKEGAVEVIVLREKYIPSKEIENKKAMNSSLVLENKKNMMGSASKNNIRINSSITQIDNSENEILKHDGFNIKPFDIINLNKFKSANGDKSNIYKDLLKKKNKNNIQATIKSKIDEIQEKLRRYEEMVKNLGKEFSSSFNK